VNKGPTRSHSAAAPSTVCAQEPLLFADLGSRQVVADFSAGHLSSDGGVLLLRQVDHGLGLSRTLAACFRDTRDARFVDHSLPQLLAQRLYGLGLGYEDLNDHAFLRRDPLLATACDKLDPLGMDRLNPAFRGAALAAPCTLNRLELSNNKSTRCHKLAHDPAAIENCLLTMGVRCLPKHAREIVLDHMRSKDTSALSSELIRDTSASTDWKSSNEMCVWPPPRFWARRLSRSSLNR